MTREPETGSVRKQWGSAIPVALVYPNDYRVGMANLGFQFVYRLINAHPGFLAERFFFPDSRAGKNAWRTSPLSEESGRSLSDFRIVAFSVPFENDYAAVPAALLAAGIAPLQKDRGPFDPVVVAGGVSVSMNPEPLAAFLDLAFIGEMAEPLDAAGLLEALADLISDGSKRCVRGEILDSLREVPGVYVPSAYDFRYAADGLIAEIIPRPWFPSRVRAVKRRSKEVSVPVSSMFTPEAEFGESCLMEINRGCSRGCRFCAGGWIHFPVRYADKDRFQRHLDAAVAGGKTIGLIGSDLARHPQLVEILSGIVEKGGRFSLSSIRPDGLTPEVIDLMVRSGQKTATLAPETASPRMKKIIGKEIPSQRFYELVHGLVTAGIPNIRFYFMVGLPGEEDEDAEAIVEFVRESRRIFVEASRPRGRIGRIAIQLNPFVPKPWTPFQWAGMAQAAVLEKRLRIVKQGLKRIPNLVVRSESVREALVQAVLSRGDRRVAGAILRAARQGGKWTGVFKAEGIHPSFYAHRVRDAAEILPWDVTDHGVRKETLARIFSQHGVG